MLKINDEGKEKGNYDDNKTVAELTVGGYKYELVRTQIDTSEDIRRNLYESKLEDHEDVPIRGVPMKEFMWDFERELLRITLVALDWNKLKAASCVGMKRTTFTERLRARGLHPTTSHMLKTQGVIKQ